MSSQSHVIGDKIFCVRRALRREFSPTKAAGPRPEPLTAGGVIARQSISLPGAAAVVFSLLTYFFSMMTAFAVVVTMWIGLIGASPFSRVHLRAYLPASDVLTTLAPDDSAANNEDDAQTLAKTANGPASSSVAPGTLVASSDTAAWCEARFRSYNPATGTFMGFDGVQHPCP
jgi:hypothetical protein